MNLKGLQWNIYCSRCYVPSGESMKISLFYEKSYLVSTCLVCLNYLFDSGSAGCVSTEDCGSNNLNTARSSKIFIVLILFSAGNYRIIDPWCLAVYHTKLMLIVVMKSFQLKSVSSWLRPKVNVSNWDAKMKLKSNLKGKLI